MIEYAIYRILVKLLLKAILFFLKEEVIGVNTVDKIFKCRWDDLNIVLEDWKKVKENFKELSIQIFLNLLIKFPFYQALFPSFAEVSMDDLPKNEDFLTHSYAIMRGIDTIMKNLSGEYEEDNRILPVISLTHKERGITQSMMKNLQKSIVFICSDFLMSNRKNKSAWEAVLGFIFKNYINSAFSEEEEDEEEEKEKEIE